MGRDKGTAKSTARVSAEAGASKARVSAEGASPSGPVSTRSKRARIVSSGQPEDENVPLASLPRVD